MEQENFALDTGETSTNSERNLEREVSVAGASAAEKLARARRGLLTAMHPDESRRQVSTRAEILPTEIQQFKDRIRQKYENEVVPMLDQLKAMAGLIEDGDSRDTVMEHIDQIGVLLKKGEHVLVANGHFMGDVRNFYKIVEKDVRAHNGAWLSHMINNAGVLMSSMVGMQYMRNSAAYSMDLEPSDYVWKRSFREARSESGW